MGAVLNGGLTLRLGLPARSARLAGALRVRCGASPSPDDPYLPAAPQRGAHARTSTRRCAAPGRVSTRTTAATTCCGRALEGVAFAVRDALEHVLAPEERRRPPPTGRRWHHRSRLAADARRHPRLRPRRSRRAGSVRPRRRNAGRPRRRPGRSRPPASHAGHWTAPVADLGRNAPGSTRTGTARSAQRGAGPQGVAAPAERRPLRHDRRSATDPTVPTAHPLPTHRYRQHTHDAAPPPPAARPRTRAGPRPFDKVVTHMTTTSRSARAVPKLRARPGPRQRRLRHQRRRGGRPDRRQRRREVDDGQGADRQPGGGRR